MKTSTELLRARDVAAMIGVCEATIWRYNRQQKMPAPIRLSTACTRWRRAEIERWLAEQEAA